MNKQSLLDNLSIKGKQLSYRNSMNYYLIKDVDRGIILVSAMEWDDTYKELYNKDAIDVYKVFKNGKEVTIMTEKKIDVSQIIKDLSSGFGTTDQEKNKVLQLFKGLIFNDDPKAKEYISKLDKATTKISKDMSEEKKKENFNKKNSFKHSNLSAEKWLEEQINKI